MSQTIKEEHGRPATPGHEGNGAPVTIIIEVEQRGAPVEKIELEFEAQPESRAVAEKLAGVLALEAEELLSELAAAHHGDGHGHEHGHHHRLQLTCIDLHFESESVKHRFLARSTWARVHHWGCRKFHIAADVAANLELRDGAPDGPALNEAKPIGHHEGCQVVWLVKPGPESNG